MNKKGQLNVGTIVILAVAIILGAVFMVSIANQSNVLTDKQAVTNQSVDVTSAYLAPTSVNASINFTIYSQSSLNEANCPLTSVAIRNSTGNTLTLTTDYLLYANQGVFSLVNTTSNQGSNTTYVDYSYCAEGYNFDGSSRGIAKLFVVFFAFILLAVSIVGIREWIK